MLNTDDAAHLFLGVEWAATLGRGPGWSKIKKQLCDNDEGLAVFPLPGSLQLEGKHAWRSFFWGDPRHPSGKALKKSKKSKKPA